MDITRTAKFVLHALKGVLSALEHLLMSAPLAPMRFTWMKGLIARKHVLESIRLMIKKPVVIVTAPAKNVLALPTLNVLPAPNLNM
ncbi:MAG: hypothetical protein QF535_21335 [Anaerolineales bacterium]|nr:hypothetical protein [Anaerolineales bacterium]